MPYAELTELVIQTYNVEQVKVKILPDGRLSRADAAKFLGLKSKTLACWKSQGVGPRSVAVGGRIFYQLLELERFRDGGVSLKSRPPGRPK
jgi:hypothetical protein